MKHKFKTYGQKSLLILRFAGFLILEIIMANLKVALAVISPIRYLKPGIIGVPLSCKNDIEITLLANLISLTPGTLTLDVSPDRKYLYIHTICICNPEKLKTEIKTKFETPILEFLE